MSSVQTISLGYLLEANATRDIIKMKQFCENVVTFIDIWNINILNLIFVGLSLVVIIFGFVLIQFGGATFLKPLFNYGKLYQQARKDRSMLLMEVPKGWFSHFYVFASVFSLWSMYLVVQVSLLHRELPKYVEVFLNLIGGGRNRGVYIDSTTTIIVVSLVCLQCLRRCYETNCVQIFSKNGKINLSHYFLGYLHYFGVIMTLLLNAEGFVEGSTPSAFNFAQITWKQYIAIATFTFSWWQQYRCNIILVNLRKDGETARVATEKHLLPDGGFFEWVSAPHMLFEVIIYISLLGFLASCKTWWFVVIWVFCNQVYNAVSTHQWYKVHFKNYPKNRKAIIPFIL